MPSGLSQRYHLPNRPARDRGPARLAHGVKDGDRDRDRRMCSGRGHHFRQGAGLYGPWTYRRVPALTFRRERKYMEGEVNDREMEQRI